MSRWSDRLIHPREIPHFPVALYEVVILFGTLAAETILASVHVRAHQQAGHMNASDLIKSLHNTLQGGNRPHMENLPGWCHSRVNALLLWGPSNAAERSITKAPGCRCNSYSNLFYLTKSLDVII
jgi:hypothetical protein